MSANNTLVRKNYQLLRNLFIILILLIALSLACSIPFVGDSQPAKTTETPLASPTPTATSIPLAPDLVESDPPQGVEVPLDGPLTFYFNQAMNRDSVEAAFISQFDQEITFSWVDDSTVMLYLSQPLEPESELAIDLGTGAQSSQGMGVLQPISLQYQTAGYLHLSQSIPEAGVVDVDPSSAVIAAYNRPIVPIGADQASLPEAFTLEPTASGKAEWINSSTYIFYPDPALIGGTEYTVRINQQLKSTDGGPLQNATDWSFTTSLPRIESIEPVTEIPWELDPEIIITFNQPMDQTSLEQSFSFRKADGTNVAGGITWEENFTKLIFTPEEILQRDTEYILEIPSAAQSSGGTTLEEGLLVTVYTVPELTIYNTDPAAGDSIDSMSSVGLTFSSPLMKSDQSEYISLEPSIGIINNWWNEEINELRIGGILEPNTDYTLTISGEISDIWGGKLGQDYQFNFRTSPVNPNIILPVPADMIFLTPQESSISVQAVNIPFIPLTVGAVPIEDFKTMMGPNGYELRNNYQNPNQSSWQQSLDLPPDDTQNVDLFLTPNQSPLEPGIYFFRFDVDETQIYPGPYLLAVSNIQMTIKTSSSDALIWAIDLRDGSPLKNAPISLYNENGEIIAEGSTDEQGVFKTSFEAREDPYLRYYAITDQPGQDTFGVALSGWNLGVSPWDFGITAYPETPGLKVYFYTDRPVYRPGQTIYFRAIARQAHNSRYTLPHQDTLPISLSNPNGEIITTFELPLSAFGTAHGEYELPSDIQTGNYNLFASEKSESGIQFQVASYRKPEINLAVDFSPKNILAGEKLQATINARYYFDAPVSNLPLKWALYAYPRTFTLPGYQVGVIDTSWLDAFTMPDISDQFGELISEGKGQTDESGLLNLEFPTDLKDQLLRYTLEITAEDESGLPVSARDYADVHPDQFYIGIHPDTWASRVDEEINFELLAADWDGKPNGSHALKAEFQKVTWLREDPPPERSFEQPTFTAQYTLISSTDVSTNDEGKASLSFTPTEAGTFLLDIKSTQGSSRSQVLIWVGGAGQPVWPNVPNSRLQLTADKENYKPGESAQIFIPNPMGNEASALITLERSIVMNHQVSTIPAGGRLIEIPLTSEEAPNVYISVTLIGQSEEGRPDFRQGFINIPVEPSEQTLQVTLSREPESTGPGDEVSIEIQVNNSLGEPIQGEFSLAVIDLAALAIAEPNAPGIVEAFYSQAPNGIDTSISLAAHTYRKTNLPGGLGGGGDFAGALVVRESFPDTAYWNAEVNTDADGKAQIELTLPDSLTTWKIDTRGTTTSTLVGEADGEIITSKDLLIRPVTPRFFVVGDHSMLAAVVNNNTDEPIQAEVSLQATGFQIDDPNVENQKISLAPQNRTRVEWWGTAQDVDQVELIFSVKGVTDGNGQDYQDAAKPTLGDLPVLRFTAPQTYRTSGSMDEGGDITELVSLPRSFDAQGSQLDVELSPSLAAAMMNSLEALESYPFESTEQILSSFLPNLETLRTMQDFGIPADQLQSRLNRTLNQGITRLKARQNPDFGWGWWQGGESDPYITAYVLFGLSRARSAGIDIPIEIVQGAVNYLTGTPVEGSDQLPVIETITDLDRLTFIQYSLSSVGEADIDQVNQLYQQRNQLNPWAQSLLALTLESLIADNDQARTILSELETSAIRSASSAHWDFISGEDSLLFAQSNMHTTLSNTAVVLYALAQRDPGSPLVTDTIRYLMAHRGAEGAWSSTYTTTWILLALNEVMKGTGELGGDFTFDAVLNQNPIAEGQASGVDQLNPVTVQIPGQRLYSEYPNSLVIRRDAGQGRLYYSTSLKAYQFADQVTTLSQGLSIEKAFCQYPASADNLEQECTPIDSAQAGERVKVKISLILPNDIYYLAVEDFIPAGSEILDTRLLTSEQGLEGEPEAVVTYDPSQPFSKGWGWWLFNPEQIYDDHITWTANYLPAGSYQLTYTITALQAGEYQVIPAKAWQLYFPEVQGHSAGSLFTIRPQ